MISGITPFFIVADVPATLAFYRDMLGFDIVFRGPTPEDEFFGIVRRGGATLWFKALGATVDGKEVPVEPVPNFGREPAFAWDAYVEVPDPDALAAEFAARGVVFAVPLTERRGDGLRGFVIKDIDGYGLVFGNHVADPTARLPSPSAVVFCSEVDRVSQFYQSVARMTRISGDATHTVLELEGFQLVVHGLRGEPSVNSLPTGRLPVREDSYIKVCLPVESLAAARERVAELGGQLYPAEKEWQARGFRACDGYDPEGNVFQLRESAVKPR